jgi:hypothetical protein
MVAMQSGMLMQNVPSWRLLANPLLPICVADRPPAARVYKSTQRSSLAQRQYLWLVKGIFSDRLVVRPENISKITLFCDVTLCSLLEVINVSEERAASFFKVNKQAIVE